MFWDNAKTEKVISDNTYNTGSVTANLGDVSNGRVLVDINKNFRLKLYVLDKNTYETTGELIPMEKYESDDIP